ncbi:hypothetical protein SAMN02745157_4542 [Kaistia soli DSM 19436]|uniref:Uncharacterized protein n=1 Tax=Kaistia soli DSM 19436 TaxID=1122133 RepID=A0A1M5LAF2_9HYPH|nr:hypothetical protein [Kaistia soli]SHG62082.1 hypothetical protein SAMN02745157_4542 [Kaistia soli DSM 19436]
MNWAWNSSLKRYGIACFISSIPADPDGDGDSQQFFDELNQARDWAKRAIEGGRFKYLALWDGVSGTHWEWIEDFCEEPST